MGVTVRQKVKGRGNKWWVYVHHDGKARSKCVGDKHAAEAVASEIRRRIKLGQFSMDPEAKANRGPRFSDYARRYIEDYAKVTCKWSTWSGYVQILRDHLEPELGTKRMRDITRADIKRLLLKKSADGLATGTIQNIQVMVSGIFTHAYEDNVITAHPALKMGRYIPKRDRKASVKPLSGEQTRQVLRTCEAEFAEWYPLMLTAFRTGMRLGELLGLGWDDLDIEGRQIEIRRGYSHMRFSTPKSRKSRLVDMSDQLAKVLAEHRTRLLERFGGLPTVEANLGRAGTQMVPLVFPNSKGKPTDGDSFRRRPFRMIIERSGLPKMRIHDIRHTFASLLLQQGESIYYVKEQMGHASIQMTVDTYGHLVPGSNRDAVNRLDDPMEVSGDDHDEAA